MAKKSKQARLYAKQQQRLKKIEKKARQKGIDVDLSEFKAKKENVTKKEVAEIKEAIRGVPEQKAAEPDERTNNILKLTQKQLQKAIAKRRQQIAPKRITAKPLKVSKEQKKRYDQAKEFQQYADNLDDNEEPVAADIFADTVIANYRAQIHAYPQYAEPLLSEWLDLMIADYGKEDVALMLQNGAEAGVVVTHEIAYDDEYITTYVTQMLDYLPGLTKGLKADILDQFETSFYYVFDEE